MIDLHLEGPEDAGGEHVGQCSPDAELDGLHGSVADGGQEHAETHPCQPWARRGNYRDNQIQMINFSPCMSVRTTSQGMGPWQGIWNTT